MDDMTVKEMLSLLHKANRISGNPHGWLRLFSDGSGGVCDGTDGNVEPRRFSFNRLPEMIDQLSRAATPPKPETVTINVPFEHAVWYAANGANPPTVEACRQAIAQWIHE